MERSGLSAKRTSSRSVLREMRHLNVARLKAGAHYTGFIKKKKCFFEAKSAVCLYRPGLKDILTGSKNAKPLATRGQRLKRFIFAHSGGRANGFDQRLQRVPQRRRQRLSTPGDRVQRQCLLQIRRHHQDHVALLHRQLPVMAMVQPPQQGRPQGLAIIGP